MTPGARHLPAQTCLEHFPKMLTAPAPFRVPVGIALIATLAIPATAASQSAACAFDTTAYIRTDSLVLGLAPVSYGDRAVRTDYLRAAQAIREYFCPPLSLRLPFAFRVVGTSP